MTEEEIAALQRRNLAATCMLAAAGTVAFHDQGEALAELATMAAPDDKGVLQMPADALKTLASKKPHWVKPAGTGTRGSTAAPVVTQTLSYAELIDGTHEDEMLAMLRDKPADFAALRTAHQNRKR